jgi:gamma-glutamyltranspeptidase/glutathione hydrolase
MIQGSSFTTRPQLAGTFGMVASTHWLASAAGLAVLEQGGTAFDAAVAAGLVLQVVEPHMSGPAGEVPVIGYDAGLGQVFVLDGQGPAPEGATLAAFGSLGLDLVPGDGLLAPCVPAAFGTWMLLLQRYGRLGLRSVMQYAIGYARDGYPMTAGASAGIASVAGLFQEHWPTSAEIYLADGVPSPGSRFANPVLAAAYQRILDEAEAVGRTRDSQIDAARRAFYEGFVAEAIAAYTARAEVMDLSGERHRALLTGSDLAGWRASAEAPVTLDYHGLTVGKTGPWGQGPVFLQQLALLDGSGIDAMEPGSAEFIHTVVECAKLAFADREAWYGDPRFGEVPLEGLLSAEYAAQRRGLVGAEASGELIPGAPDGRPPRLPGYATGAVRVPGGAGTGPRRARPAGAADRAIRATRATPATSTSPTSSATWCPPPPAAAGCRAHRSSRAWDSAWAPGPRYSPSPRGCPTRSRRGNGRGPRCRRAWPCVTASPTWRSARRAATSKTSGRWPSSSTMCCSG